MAATKTRGTRGAEGRKRAAKDGCHGNKGGRTRGLLEADGGAVVGARVAGFDEGVRAELLDGGGGGGRRGGGGGGVGEAGGGAVLGALVAGFDEFVLAELLDGGEGGVLTGEDEVDGALACDVLDLTA